jgi:hypothetical protein
MTHFKVIMNQWVNINNFKRPLNRFLDPRLYPYCMCYTRWKVSKTSPSVQLTQQTYSFSEIKHSHTHTHTCTESLKHYFSKYGHDSQNLVYFAEGFKVNKNVLVD